VTDERIRAVTIAMSRALDALATETPDHEREHECRVHVDAGDDECCIAAAVIPAEGVE
jgi:hypothetical protein